jgi:hypothetical protein
MMKFTIFGMASLIIVCVGVASAGIKSKQLVASWHFENSATDASGNGNTGTLFNGATYTSGVFGNAISFDGINDQVTIPFNSTLDVSNIRTVALWVKKSSDQS